MGLAIRMAIAVTTPVLAGVLVWWGVMLTAPAVLIRRWRRRHRGAPRRRLWPSAVRAQQSKASPPSPAEPPSGVVASGQLPGARPVSLTPRRPRGGSPKRSQRIVRRHRRERISSRLCRCRTPVR